MQFRKKPVIVEAFQMTQEAHDSNKDWPNWLHAAWNGDIEADGSFCLDKKLIHRIYVLNVGQLPLRLTAGDWIIQDQFGGLRLCEAEQFSQTYEPIDV